jgi:hypothetical protein
MDRRVVAIVLCALALAACGGDEQQVVGAGLSADEVRWVRAFAAWGDDIGQAVGDARAARDEALAGGDRSFFTQALRPVRDCAGSLERAVPDAPTRRLRAARRLLERTCAAYVRFADAHAATLRGAPGDPLLRAEAAETRAEELLLTVYQGVGSLLRDNRPLPRTRGGDRSRVDPLYSRLGGELAYERVEVRCWSEDEWRDVIRERSAFSNGYLNVHATLGFAWPDDRRAHLAPEICAALDRFSLDGEGADSEELATAVVVLAHEVGHLRSTSAAEAEVECRAIQEARALAQKLGADAAEADALVEFYLEQVYPETDALYHSTQCHPGGYLDLDPANPRWP